MLEVVLNESIDIYAIDGEALECVLCCGLLHKLVN